MPNEERRPRQEAAPVDRPVGKPQPSIEGSTDNGTPDALAVAAGSWSPRPGEEFTRGRRAAYVEHFRARVVQDAFTEATAAYWIRRAEQFEAVGNPRCDETARACRARARVAVMVEHDVVDHHDHHEHDVVEQHDG